MNSRGLAALAAQVEHLLVFRWPERNASLLLPAFLLLSLAGHAIAFFLFQVAYPPAVGVTPPPAQITLITADQPESAAFLRWVQAQDPAVVGSVQEVAPPPDLGQLLYRPSYATARPFRMEVEPAQTQPAFPAARTLLDSRDDSPAPAPAPVRRSVPNSLAFSEGLAARDAAPNAPIQLATPSRAHLRPTVFLVGIGGKGEVRYCFPQSGSEAGSSSDPKIDEQAELLLRAHPFSPSSTPLQWGFATFTWGAQAQESAAPRPEAAR
jgi:hypothetical protein